MSSHRVLLLSPWFTALKVISVEMAIRLIYSKKAIAVENYDETISSPSVTWQVPAVVQLAKPPPGNKKGIKFSKVNIFTRDGGKCSYCGVKKPMKEMNYDHVVPRRLGGKTEWGNIVLSCYFCNEAKGGRTPEQAGMKLLNLPYRPTKLPMTYVVFDKKTIPSIWEPYCQFHSAEEGPGEVYMFSKSNK